MGEAFLAFLVMCCSAITWISVADAIHVGIIGQFTGAVVVGAIFGKVWK